jgi:hypothetical protein
MTRLSVLSCLTRTHTHPELYAIVTRHMMHGPCGVLNPSCPCMEGDICTNKHPKDFQETTTDATGAYPVYCRRDDGRVHVKGSVHPNTLFLMQPSVLIMFCDLRGGCEMNNRWVVLCMKYNAHGQR